MILRLRSGSVTPASRARKRSSASTAISGTLKWSRKAATTWSPSFLRISPWSTKTQVSWSPTARWVSSAATEESTPPESPQITLPSPTCSRIRATCSSITEAALQAMSQPADVAQEGLEDLRAVRGVHHLGVELDPVQAALGVLERRHRRLARGGQRREARAAPRRRCRGGSSSSSARPAVPASSRPGSCTVSCERPNSPTSAPSTRPPSSSTIACMP